MQHFYTKTTRIWIILSVRNDCIWSNGIFPNKWQEAIAAPILKPRRNKLHSDSYRPINLTCLCKLLKKILNTKLRWYLETDNLLERNQNFRKYRSTINSLIKFEKYLRSLYQETTPNSSMSEYRKGIQYALEILNFPTTSTVEHERQYV